MDTRNITRWTLGGALIGLVFALLREFGRFPRDTGEHTPVTITPMDEPIEGEPINLFVDTSTITPFVMAEVIFNVEVFEVAPRKISGLRNLLKHELTRDPIFFSTPPELKFEVNDVNKQMPPFVVQPDANPKAIKHIAVLIFSDDAKATYRGVCILKIKRGP